jgi:tRNA G18 (ribose-2'-O)-methylase SpoU
VGSIFRTADAFGVSKIYLTGYTPTPENPNHKIKISKTALGAEDFVPWEYSKSAVKIIKKLKAEKINIIALENNIPVGAGFSRPQTMNKFKPKFPLALILGEEVEGVDKRILKLCDKIVEIPMQGKKESLNVSVAFGVAAYAISSE